MTTAAPFCWYELMTPDLDAAQAFYASVVGWTAQDAGMPGFRYTIFSTGGVGTGIAGAMTMPPELCDAQVPPHWIGYVRVEDVDAMLPRLVAAGGSVMKDAADIPGVGRFAVVADPGGAAFCLFREAMASPAPAVSTEGPAGTCPPGRIGWHELQAHDGEAAFAFYSGLFGWSETERMDMGPMGFYRLFATGGPAVGGMMTKVPECPRPFWLYYFGVDALDAAIERLNAAGGKVAMGPMEVPGGAWIVQAFDPQGALFALVAPKR